MYPDKFFLAYNSHFPAYRLYIIPKEVQWELDINENNLVVPEESEELKTHLPRELTKVYFQSTLGK